MNQKVLRALACATGLAAALSAAGAIALPSEAQTAGDGSSARLAQILREDPTASLDSSGRLFYTEPLPAGAHAAARAATMAPSAAPQFPLDQTFQLHSKSGSQRTIYLDFDGGNVSGTAWNDEGLPNGNHPGWDPADNGASFTNPERTLVQEIWQWVAEDYAPFDVDVTTEDPGEAGILRSSGGDQVYGTRALITPDDDAVGQVCGECVGVAYLNVFDEVGGNSQPVWIFPQFYDEAKGIAETISHEVGHNLNLEHDGNSETEYAPGHNSWAPIMGNSDLEPISQWSKGDYPGASNHQDDFAVITNAGLDARSDEAGNTLGAAATGLPAGTAYITSRNDKDFYSIGDCSGAVQVAAVGAADGTNLDIELRLYSADGTQVAIANPVSAKVDANVASGMSATINTSVASGTYVVAVDGVGRGSWSNGYDDYASVGAYTLDVSGCDGGPVDPPDPDPVVPGAPVITSVTGGPRGRPVTASVGWNAPADDGGAAITGYRVKATRWSGGVAVWRGYLDGLAADETFVKIVLPKAGSWSFRVQAINDVGYGVLSPSSRRVQAR